jgi:hypothetical protein
MSQWEYLFVDCNLGENSWTPRFANRERLPDWESGTPVHEFCNRLGSDGWELVGSQIEMFETESRGRVGRKGKVSATYDHRRVWHLTFKRMKSPDE